MRIFQSVITGSLNQSGSSTVSGSLNHSGDYNHTGSVYHSGSKILNGVFVQTGSLLISGSTTQTGTNNLLGNTTLSGSIIISGSVTSPPTPTIKVYGDMETNGVIKFMPVNKDIDTSISASYIYVSGSTNDLYFSQNGNGYANTTRLRWIEGNLYTGLLNGGLITTQSSTVYQVSSGSGIVVNLNASYNDNPYPTIQYLNWGNLTASIAPLSASYDQSFVAIQSNGTLIAQNDPYTDGQFNTLIPIGVVIHQNRSTINGTQTFASLAYGWKQRSSDFIRAFGPLKLSGLTLSPSGSSTGSLVVSSGTAWSDGRNYTVDPNNPSYITDTGTTVSKIYRYRQSGSNWVYDTNAGAGYPTIDPANYSNNGVLTPVPTNDWTIQRVYWFPNSVTKALYVYYGNATYTTETDAIANVSIESFTEAPNTAAQAVYLGALVVRYNANFNTAASYKILPGGLFRNIGGIGGGGGSVTQTLSGLSDVSISGPTNGQPLVYNTSLAKWQNSSTLTASLNGNASTASTASYVTTLKQDVTISGSLAVTGSYSGWFNSKISSNLTNGLDGDLGYAALYNFDGYGGPVPNSPDNSWNESVISVGFSGRGLQIAGGYDTGDVYFRKGNTTWQSWNRILNATVDSYAANMNQNVTTGSQVTFGGITGSLQGTASYATSAATASLANGSVKVTQATIGISGAPALYTTNKATVSAGTTTVHSFSSLVYEGGFVDYVVSDGTNARAGQIQTIFAAGQVQFNETTTMDIGNTNDFVWQVVLSGADVNYNAVVTSGAWTTKLIIRTI